MFDHIFSLLGDANFRWVLMGTFMLGVCGGLLSPFTVLRRQSLLGDVLAHAALPGICIAYLLSGSKSSGYFFIGALLAGLVAIVCIQAIVNHSRLKQDAALAIVLSVFFGFGITLISYIQKLPVGNQSGIDRFLFGHAASLVYSDVWLIAICSIVILLIITLFYKELKIFVFDEGFADSIGLRTRNVHFLLTTLIAVVVVIGIQIVGVVLIAALLIAPALTAGYWARTFFSLLCFSAFFGAIAGTFGTLTASMFENVPTGPLIVVVAAICFILSIIFSPHKGLLAARRDKKSRPLSRHVSQKGG